MPLDPPCTRKVSPALSRPRVITLSYTVNQFSGSVAASFSDSPFGTGRQCAAGTVQYSAYPPPGVSAQTMSPGFHCVTSDATSTTFPATSSPSSGDAPGGGG